jgi:hypothetical protein
MSMLVEMRVAELLNARLCHELVSPVGAINNGVELLGEEDPDFVRDAIQLIGQSARKASQRLQFYRFAYGTNVSGSAGGGAPPSGRDLSVGLFEETKLHCDWQAGAATLPSDWQRLACNMLVLAGEALPRGGCGQGSRASRSWPKARASTLRRRCAPRWSRRPPSTSLPRAPFRLISPPASLASSAPCWRSSRPSRTARCCVPPRAETRCIA